MSEEDKLNAKLWRVRYESFQEGFNSGFKIANRRANSWKWAAFVLAIIIIHLLFNLLSR